MRKSSYKLTLFALFFTLIYTAESFAKITVVSISGASTIDIGASTPIIYGGTAGTSCSGGTGTCDNCTGGATLAACNHARITPTTVLTIQFTSDDLAGYPMIGDDSTGALIQDSTASVTANATASISITWDTICGKIATTGHTNCETYTATGSNIDAAVILRIGIDAVNDDKLDNTSDQYLRVSFKVQRSMQAEVDLNTAGASTDASNGIVAWSVYPGDGKVYLENVETYSGFPSSSNVLYNKLHLFYSEGICSGVSTVRNNSTEVSTGIQSSGELDDDRFLGFTNDISYVFKVALEDQAGNIGLFFPDSTCTDGIHSATPSEVFGLLKNQNNCFIATAAYGSPLEKHVQILRQFRDSVLLKFDLGKLFVRAYYRLSPPVAQVISESPVLRTASRVVLFPVWALAAMSTEIGFWPSLVISLSFLISLGIVLRWSLPRQPRERAQ